MKRVVWRFYILKPVSRIWDLSLSFCKRIWEKYENGDKVEFAWENATKGYWKWSKISVWRNKIFVDETLMRIKLEGLHLLDINRVIDK